MSRDACYKMNLVTYGGVCSCSINFANQTRFTAPFSGFSAWMAGRRPPVVALCYRRDGNPSGCTLPGEQCESRRIDFGGRFTDGCQRICAGTWSVHTPGGGDSRNHDHWDGTLPWNLNVRVSGFGSESVRRYAVRCLSGSSGCRDCLPWSGCPIAGRTDVWTPRGNYSSHVAAARSLNSGHGAPPGTGAIPPAVRRNALTYCWSPLWRRRQESCSRFAGESARFKRQRRCKTAA
jgi:hypothetical protein